MHPMHPDLAALASAAKAFSRTVRSAHVPDEADLAAALRSALGPRPGWLGPQHRQGDPAHYLRHVLFADPSDDFVITAITWLPGQQSAVHGHYVWCAYGVVEGEAAEETFDTLRAPQAGPDPLRTRVIRTGELSDIDLGGPLYHRVSNRAQHLLVTLHVYGIAAERLTSGVNRLYGPL